MKATAKQIMGELLNRLWEKYLERVSYAKIYAELVSKKGGKVVNDHIAFRTFNTHTGEQPEGIRAIKHIIETLEYKPVEKYVFKKKKLTATHFEHADELFPKIFVSQLEVEQLPKWAQNTINQTVKDTPYLLSDEAIELLGILRTEKTLTHEASKFLIDDLVNYFRRPWSIPFKDDVLKINDVSQYAAWTLLHGNSVNHFTAYINFQEVEEWTDLETTCKGLKDAGIPMKDTIEGQKGSKLQQSATQAVKEEVEVRTASGVELIDWTYAYYELAQRDFIEENGKIKLFSGFLGEQATHLFDMTKTRDN
ncbi:DUF1338 domain-containing protein [Maribellus maritimus]|uniref:DUF1338 domain-containing protein n=1 Tax=Maribellus maritimus TaxID=2870838 RepID=UPI001EEC27F1|nr:DUF1338 domain-containing protein [Maribellus maritimus]MCG6186136.1 DUF1338 domain-containing protein [Maribellus maritimus]